MSKIITVKEYDLIAPGSKNEDNYLENMVKYVSLRTFENLKIFVLENKADDKILDFMVYKRIKKFGEVLQVQNYVGTIETKDRVIVEILPKIYNLEEDEKGAATKRILLKMLKTLKTSPFKKFNLTNLKTTRMPLFEIFISMFLDELTKIIPKGIKSDYIKVEENANVLKGKLLLSKHLLKNIVHKEKFYIQYDEYLKNRPENRIIKTTLKLLLTKSTENNNQKLIRMFLFILDDINESQNIDKDFAQCKIDRTMHIYKTIIQWCKIFLKGESFTSFKGKSITYALLFPMETLFENYVTHYFRTKCDLHTFYSQHRKFYLAKYITNEENNIFMIKPDMVAIEDKHCYILDAKWKRIDENERKHKYNIAQSDFYQLFSYAKIYENEYNNFNVSLFLVYPKTEKFTNEIYFRYNDYSSSSNLGTSLVAFPFDLAYIEKNRESFMNILENIKE